MRNEVILLNFDEEIELIVNEIGCTKEVATDYVHLEDAYYDEIGLNVYDDFIESADSSDIVVEEQELHSFIVRHSNNLDLELCERIQEVELEYFKRIGLITE